MHEELIGQKASLSLPCSVDPGRLLRGFIEELMEVGGLEPAEPEELERNLREAITAVCQMDEPDEHVVATLIVRAHGVDVRLRNAADPAANGDGERVVTVTAA